MSFTCNDCGERGIRRLHEHRCPSPNARDWADRLRALAREWPLGSLIRERCMDVAEDVSPTPEAPLLTRRERA